MATYVMGDIHGAHLAMVECLQAVAFSYTEDTLIQLGDVADGYNDVFACIELLLQINNLVALKGNHDAWFKTFIETGKHPKEWAGTARATEYSYKHALELEGPLTPDRVPATHQRFFASQQLYHIDTDNQCYVHAGFDRRVDFYKQRGKAYTSDRTLWAGALAFNYAYSKGLHPSVYETSPSFATIFIGHTPTVNWKQNAPMKAANIYNLDTGAGHGARLTIMNAETKEYWQSSPVFALYPDHAPGG